MSDLNQSTARVGSRSSQVAAIVFWAAVSGFLVTFGFNALNRRDNFYDPDMMNFVDVARNVVVGRGLTQSTLGFNTAHFAVNDPIPVPLVSQPPLYPLLVAALISLGVPAVEAALLVSVVAFGLVLWLVYWLTKELYGATPALTAVALLLLYDPVYRFGSTAYSDLTGLAFVCLSLWLLARGTRPGAGETKYVVAAGLAAGLGFATRYAVLPLVAVELVIIWLESQTRRRDLLLLGLAFLIPASLVWGHNWAVSGALMPSPNPSNVGLVTNLAKTIRGVFGAYWDTSWLSSIAQIGLCLGVSALMGLWLVVRRRFWVTLYTKLVVHRRYILPLWGLSYLIFLVYQRTVTHFDGLGPRLVLPASIAVCIILAVLLNASLQIKPQFVVYGVAGVALAVLVREVRFTATTGPVDRRAPITESALLNWIAADTTAQDLIIGLDTVYVPFYFDHRSAISYSPFPYTDYLDYQHLSAYVDQHCSSYRHAYLVLKDMPDYVEARWMADFGPFIADLAQGRWQNYRRIGFLRRLEDASVFSIGCEALP